jgi:hypothetical protein
MPLFFMLLFVVVVVVVVVTRYHMSDFNDDDGKITIIAGKERNWRTTYSTTVTFSARFATLVMVYVLP